MKATMNNHAEITELLLNYGANPRLENFLGETALSISCVQSNSLICQQLLVARADVN